MADALTITVERPTLTITLGTIPVDEGGGSVGPDLTAIEALTGTGIARRTGSDTWTLDTATAAGLALLDDADAATQRATLGLVIGTNVLAYDAGLTSLIAVDTAADLLPYTTAANTWAGATLTSFARSLLDDADAATARATLGVGADNGGWSYVVLGSDFVESGGAITDVTGLAFTPAADTLYLVEAFLVFTSASVNAGLQWTFSPPASGATWSAQHIFVPISVSTQVLRFGQLDNAASGTGVTSTSVQYPALGTCLLKMGSSPSGTLKVRANTEVPASAITILAGSFIRYRAIS